MAQTFELVEKMAPNAVIKVIGVGGGGGNAVAHMVNSSVEGVEFITANTDSQAIKNCGAKLQLQLCFCTAVVDGLRVGVGGDEFHPVHAAADHVRDRVAAAAADADDLDHRVRNHPFHQFEMCHVHVLVIVMLFVDSIGLLLNSRYFPSRHTHPRLRGCA